MDNQNKIKHFLNPKTIAVIGASSTPNKVGDVLMEKLKKFKGKVIPINNQFSIVSKRLAYKTVLHYPKKIDLAIIAIPAKFVPKALKQCAKKQIKNIIIISAGFSEKKKYKLRDKILKIKQKYNLNILGPNCFGIFNPKLNLDATFSNSTPKKGNIAFISQSGALWSYIADTNLGFSGYISLGNMIDLDFSDFIEYFSKERSTKKIICYVEKLKQGKRFIEACRKSKKQIIIIKAGQTPRGARAAISHTGSLATDYKVYKAAFAQAKIKTKDSFIEAFNLKKQNLVSKLKNKKITIITNAGGAGTLLTDELTKKGFKINKVIDILGTAKPIDYRRALNNLINYQGKIITILTPQKMSEPEQTAHLIATHPNNKKTIAVFLGDKSIKEAVKILKKNKVPVFTKAI